MKRLKKMLSLIMAALFIVSSLSVGSVATVNAAAVSGSTIVAKAEAWIGTPYSMGGNSKSGIDCSHFVNTIYSEAGLSYTYMTATSWSQDPSNPPSQLKKVSTPQKGDIVVFASGSDTSYGHAGIYISSTKFIGAQSSGVDYATFGSYWGGTRKIVGYYRYK
ncbi:NlpC/P60 family protein [Ruminiclostridium sufflavum DSM 19573]|uniref:NlpC/P60 family protein n=1 Tax=Ruminiclostridium sufflavum DSM 19573 TaxID=1121337 RepID=A0A318XNL6_9FIRM|nr:NlpC/P60 family protein [Ruminiclostridium sufflavum]PYG89745.1 NlpC/P60 family protein [Ruminiclostridium sufflavum DSM 19573]